MTAPTPSPPRAVRRAPSGVGMALLVVALVAAGMVAVAGVRSVWHRLDRDPSGDGHTRVLFVGDSMMYGASFQLTARFEGADAQVRFVGAPGTGLLSGQGWWNREITVQQEQWHPDVVVIEACCNYALGEPPYEMDNGAIVTNESEDMYALWTEQARSAVKRAGANGAKVYWVVTPPASPKEWPLYTTRIQRFNDIIDEIGVERIDWASAVAPDGEFQTTIDVNGSQRKVRKDDGLHLTDAGNVLVTEVTYEAIKGDLGLA